MQYYKMICVEFIFSFYLDGKELKHAFNFLSNSRSQILQTLFIFLMIIIRFRKLLSASYIKI